MNPSPMLQLLIDKKGAIIGAATLAEGPAREAEVQSRIEPLEGQSLLEIRVPEELGRLDTVEAFRRLTEEYFLPRGSKQLARRRTGRSAGRNRKSRGRASI